MPEIPFSIEQILTLMAEAPAHIATVTADLTPDQLRAAPDPDEWSANDVLAHLRACADVWGDCIAKIIAEDHPTIRAMSPRTWIRKTNYLDLQFRPSLEAYTTQRASLLVVLKSLRPEDWSRSATVKGAGKVLERTVLYYADSIPATNALTSSRSHTSPGRCAGSADSVHPSLRSRWTIHILPATPYWLGCNFYFGLCIRYIGR
jgi:hypothetical protein